jgi:hypothetical protein
MHFDWRRILSPRRLPFSEFGPEGLPVSRTRYPWTWGSTIAGWLAGLPVVAGPILFLLVLAHGPLFGAHAAALSLSAILASEAFTFAYAWTCRSNHWSVCLAMGLPAWLLAAILLSFMPASPAHAIAASLAQLSSGKTSWRDAARRQKTCRLHVEIWR